MTGAWVSRTLRKRTAVWRSLSPCKRQWVTLTWPASLEAFVLHRLFQECNCWGLTGNFESPQRTASHCCSSLLRNVEKVLFAELGSTLLTVFCQMSISWVLKKKKSNFLSIFSGLSQTKHYHLVHFLVRHLCVEDANPILTHFSLSLNHTVCLSIWLAWVCTRKHYAVWKSYDHNSLKTLALCGTSFTVL